MKSEDSMTLKIRRRDTEELKVEAVRVVCDSARLVAQVARDLGIADHLLYRWRAEQQQAESRGHFRQAMRTEHEERARLRQEHANVETGAGFFKMCGGVLRAGTAMRYQMIQEYDRRYPIRLMCRALAVSPAGYYVADPPGECPLSGQSDPPHRTMPAAPRESPALWEPTDVASPG